jgi:hypothetical protein
MKLSRERVTFLAKSVVEGLLREKCVSNAEKTEELVRKVEGIIHEELMVEDRINAEVDRILKTHEGEIEKGNMDYRKMFQMVKTQLVKERGIVL